LVTNIISKGALRSWSGGSWGSAKANLFSVLGARYGLADIAYLEDWQIGLASTTSGIICTSLGLLGNIEEEISVAVFTVKILHYTMLFLWVLGL